MMKGGEFYLKDKAASFVCKSPFWVRHVNTLKELTAMERIILDWAFAELDDDNTKSELVFEDMNYTATRDLIRTLGSEVKVAWKFLDIWCYLLNLCEELRDASSPSRLFVAMITSRKKQRTVRKHIYVLKKC